MQIRIEIPDLPSIEGDENLLWQVFQNLLANAIKFKRAEAAIVTIGFHTVESETVFWVQDNGIGIKEKDFDQVFVMYKKLNNRQYLGSGIGLATCKSIVDKHGGRVWFESVYGEGTTFYFTIPSIESLLVSNGSST